MTSNFHTHSTWCDGCATPEEMIQGALACGFQKLGFSSHARLPGSEKGTLSCTSAPRYAAEIRALARTYAAQIKIYLGVEADYIPGETTPEYARYAFLKPDYIIGSVHYVRASDGVCVCVDDSPENLARGIQKHFAGDAVAYVKAYYQAVRTMVASYDFDIIGHLDLVRKFNVRHPLFDEASSWYQEEVAHTVEVVAGSGKIVEVNTGAIARGWLSDAYPAEHFRARLRARGVRFMLNSDAHTVEGFACAFDRYAQAETYCTL